MGSCVSANKNPNGSSPSLQRPSNNQGGNDNIAVDKGHSSGTGLPKSSESANADGNSVPDKDKEDVEHNSERGSDIPDRNEDDESKVENDDSDDNISENKDDASSKHSLEDGDVTNSQEIKGSETDSKRAEANTVKNDGKSDDIVKNDTEEGQSDSNENELEKFEMQIKNEEEDKEDIVSAILHGQMNIEIPPQVKIVRIFTSSTFTDTFVERNTLMETVYQKLKEYCQSRGYDFQVVDMRWGVRDEATDDHMTSELCMKELKACQKLSTGPNFITFLGQKYGYRPFPPKILEKEFDVMLSSIENEDDTNLLQNWFKRDDNLVPPMYILQPIRDLLPNYNNWSVSAEERSKASSEWWQAFERMQVILRDVAEKTLVNEEEISRYKISVTEDEIRRGIINVKDKKKHCYWFKRRITDLEENLDKSKARFFIDKVGKSLDEDAVSLLNDLKSRVEGVLDGGNISKYDIKWHGEDGVNQKENEDHRQYISQLCTEFYDVLVDMINKGIEEKAKQNLDDGLLKEIAEHAVTCQEKSKTFYGRKDILDSIIGHVEKGNESRTLVVHGESGCGKTSIMAVAARKIKDLHPDVPVILRFLGTTSESSTIHNLIRSICTQIYRITGKDQPEFPDAYQDVIVYFAEALKSIKSKMVIILDSLDQLSPQDRPFHLKWMPKKINRNVTFILSTIPNAEYKFFPVLKTRLPDDSFVEVPNLENQSAGFILSAWLKMAGRKLTTNQRKIVLDAFDQCSLPLYLKLSFDQSLRWQSYSPENKTVLPLSIKGIINGLFTTIERLHGECLVRKSLGYLTAAKFGLSDAEMEDILSIDDEVLNDVYQYWTPPIRRIPPLLWVRIKSDLEAYIVSRGADGMLVNTWYHRQFIETAEHRYLQPYVVQGIHAQLADFFQGRWANGAAKPFVSKDGKGDEKDRLVAAQPNIFSGESEENEGRLNYRKLNELPYHLIRAGDIEALRKNFSCNFDFLQAKLCAGGFREVVQELKDAVKAFPDEKDVELIGKCIEMSGKASLDDPYQLAGQLTCRLSHLENYDGIRSLLMQARKADVGCLYSTVKCFPGPGGSLLHSLAGHKSTINWACSSKDGKKLVSTSEDETLKIWDVDTGEEIQSYDLETSYYDIRFYNQDNCIVLAGSYNMCAMDLNTEEIIHKEENVEGLYGKCIDVVDDGKTLLHIGSNKIRVYQIDGPNIKFAWEYEEETEENSDGVSDMVSGSRDWYAYTRGNVKELIIRKTSDQNFEKRIEVPYGLRHFQFHEDQLITLGTNSEFQKLTEMHLVIWDTSKWEIISDKMSQFHPMISTMYDVTIVKTKFGLELIWPVYTQINFWNLETGKERVTLKLGLTGGCYRQAICGDGKRLSVTEVDINKLSIEVYDLDFLDFDDKSDSDFNEIERFKRYAGLGEKDAYLSYRYPDVILSMPHSDPSVTVWNIGYQVPLRKIQFTGSMPFYAKYIGDERIALWDIQRKKVICVNVVKSKVESVTKGNIGEILSHYDMWHQIGSDKLLTTSKVENEMILWDLKTGNEIKRYCSNRKESIISFMVSEDESTAIAALRDNSDISAKLPAVCFDLSSKEIRSVISVDDQYLQMEPRKSVLSHDGKVLYLVFWSDCIYKMDTATGQTIKKIYYKAEGEDDESTKMTVFYCIDSSSAMGYLVAYLTCHVEENTFNRLVIFDLEENGLLTWHDSLMYEGTQISKDGCRMLCTSSAMGEQLKALEVWDMSKVREGKMTLLARFVPESFLRFSYLTVDGRFVCCGFTGTEGIVLLSLCGDDPDFKKDKECVNMTIDLTAIE